MVSLIKPLPGPRTLALTHLRREEAYNLRNCTRLWQLNDPVFKGNGVFAKRLSLVEEGSRLPEGVEIRCGDARVFSWRGFIDDKTPPPGLARTHPQAVFLSAYEMGFAAPGEQKFVMGGGNLEVCFWRTFNSLVRIKTAQAEPFQAIVPLGMVYSCSSVCQPIDYITKPNRFTAFLEQSYRKKEIPGYLITIDGQAQPSAGEAGGPELHWFTSNRDMFESPFFPEVDSQAAVQRLIGHFASR